MYEPYCVMKIFELLTTETVLSKTSCASKDQLLDVMINLLQSKVSTEQLEQIRSAVKERESIMSTGVGKGLAIPHAKVNGLTSNFAAFALIQDGIDYESIDSLPVHLVFLIVGPAAQNSEHIKLLSRISRIMNNDDFREMLQNCTNPAEIIDAFKQEEQRYFA